MRTFVRFVLLCTLFMSVSAVTFADGNGGIVQSPPAAASSSANDCGNNCEANPSANVFDSAQADQNVSADIKETAATLAGWLIMAVV